MSQSAQTAMYGTDIVLPDIVEARRLRPEVPAEQFMTDWLSPLGESAAGCMAISLLLDGNGLERFRADVGFGAALLHLQPAAMLTINGLPNVLDNLLTELSSRFGHDSGLDLHFKERARTAVLAAVASIHDPAALIYVIEASRARLDGGMVVLPTGARLDFEDMIARLSPDPQSLHRLRSLFQGGAAEVDAAVSKLGPEIMPTVSATALGMLRTGSQTDVLAFLGTFPAALEDEALLTALLDELTWRSRTSNGFGSGASCTAWLEVVSGFRRWTPTHLHKFLDVDDGPCDFWDRMAALRAVLPCLDGGSVFQAYGALCLLRSARLAKETRRRVVDVEREDGTKAFVRMLSNGDVLLGVWEIWEDLPMTLDGRSKVWDALPPKLRHHLARRLADRVGGCQPVALAMAGFIVSHAPKDVYADLEWLALELLNGDAGTACLRTIERDGTRLGRIRASALIDHLELSCPS